MSISEATWGEAVRLLAGARQAVLACHVDPDGDALGSMLALHRYLRANGVDSVPSWGAARPPADLGADSQVSDASASSLAVPYQYTFLPGLDELVPPARVPARPELFVAFDTASPQRLGTLEPIAAAARSVIVVDHHRSGWAFGDVQLCDGDAAATAVLIDELIERSGGELDQEMATCLYVGIVTDTGRFQHPSTSPEVMRLAARLLSYGVDQAAISRQVWEARSFGYLKVLGRSLERARLVPEAGLVWTAVYQRDLVDLGITMAEIEGMIDVLRSVESADCALVCKEQPDGSWSASLRSKGRVDVGAVASALGGGGHAFAAGFYARGDLAGIVDKVSAGVAAEGAPGMRAAGMRAAG